MKKFLLALLAFITVSCPVFASDWQGLATLKGEDKVYLDFDSVQKKEDGIEVWLRFEHPNGEKSVQLVSVRENRTMAVLSIVLYDADGNIQGQQTSHYPSYDPVVPDTLGDFLYKIFWGSVFEGAIPPGESQSA